MGSATVDDVAMWFCNAPAGAWVFSLASEIPPLGADTSVGEPKALFQIAECRVDGKTVLVLAAHREAAPDSWSSAAIAVQARFGGAPVIIMREQSEGHLRVDTSFCAGSEAQRADSFKAAAVIRARWGWDESARIRIHSGEQTFEVELRLDGEHWVATVIE